MGLLISKKRNTRLGRAIGAVVFCIECVAVAFVRSVSLGATAFYFQPSLSPILTGRPRVGFKLSILTQPKALRGLGSHLLKNVAARHSVVCGPETNCCGTAVSYPI